MRKFVILACLAASPLCAEEREFQYASYEILDAYPDCSGAGHIAYRTTFNVTLENGLYPVGNVAPVCSVTVKRGNKPETIRLPCEGAAKDAIYTKGFLFSEDFCPAPQELRPATISMEGELIGCISMSGHAFIGGNWQATTTRPKGSRVLSGAYDDPRLAVEYFVGENGKNTIFAPSLNFWLELEDEVLTSLPDATLRSVGFIQFLPLIDTTRAECQSDPRNCWLDRKVLGSVSEHVMVEETARICSATNEAQDSGTFISREVADEGEK